MSSSATAGAARRERARGGAAWSAYAVLAVLGLLPVLGVLAFGLSADSFDLRGAGGPLLAYAAGVVSVASPCVLPLVPIYLTQVAGASIEDGRIAASRSMVLRQAAAFLIGLSAVFVALGAGAGALGYFLQDHQRELQQGAGLLVIILGTSLVPSYGKGSLLKSAAMLAALSVLLVAVVEVADIRGDRLRVGLLMGAAVIAWLKFSGIVEFSFLSRTMQFDPGAGRKIGYLRSAATGAALAAGWTPCVGPVLGGILSLASQSGDVLTGTYLLAFYALGFSVPFVAAALAVSDATRLVRSLQRWAPAMEVAAALMLIGLGVLLLSGKLSALNQYFGFSRVESKL
ncbi:MAG: cytochrome c biogenesis protein CcdA [Chloroflexota bacterium]|nr:cytochrome c biogenesis protein CcdA [Dehalococcoidia bacterium]MDW8047174.1 cytochrome c biogenesis protein CcdA [Chloroflexota bacterium]